MGQDQFLLDREQKRDFVGKEEMISEDPSREEQRQEYELWRPLPSVLIVASSERVSCCDKPPSKSCKKRAFWR